MANPKPQVPVRQSNTGFVHTLPVLLVQGETHRKYFHFIIFFIENIGEYIHESLSVLYLSSGDLRQKKERGGLIAR